METTAERSKLGHSVSLSESGHAQKIDQNQNEASPTFVKESPLRIGTRLTKSASWFNSLSRRASRKTPLKKRSFAAFSGTNDSFTAPRPRLNKSDWDVRGSMTEDGVVSHLYGAGDDHPDTAPLLPHHQSLNASSRSTDCLDLDSTSFPDVSTLDLSQLDEGDLCGGGGGSTHLTVDNPALYYTIDSRRLASKHKKSMKERKLLNGVKAFNLEPERGLKYLQEFNFIQPTAESVAKFLFRQERLSKKQIGKYLGSHHEFNREVLGRFVECHEFTQLLLVQALRQFLWSFRLPGEAMQIDRVMDAFAQHYCSQNPYIFEEPDTCFILSFSIIMLNTALHNPNAKMKITVEQFVKQNKGINSGKDLPADMLEAIFRSIKEEPFKIPDETYDDLMYTFFSPEREGWLLKQGGSWKTWKRRWFVLNDRVLYYFQHTAENKPKGIIPLENVRVRALDDKDGKEWAFEVYSEMSQIIKGCKTDSSGAVVQGNHRQYRMSAASEEDRDQWIEAIQDSIRDNPFYKIIADKKAAIHRRSGNRLPLPTPTPAVVAAAAAAGGLFDTSSQSAKYDHEAD